MHRLRESDRGAAAVEFAIVVPILLILLLGIIDFGRLFFVQISLKSATMEGARAGSLGYTSSQIDSIVQQSASGVVGVARSGLSEVDVSVSPGQCDVGVQSIDVTAGVDFNWISPLFLFSFFSGAPQPGSLDIEAATEMICEV